MCCHGQAPRYHIGEGITVCEGSLTDRTIVGAQVKDMRVIRTVKTLSQQHMQTFTKPNQSIPSPSMIIERGFVLRSENEKKLIYERSN